MTASVGFRILAISGSLRAASSNTAALVAMGRLAPPSMAFSLYDGLRTIPPFSPDDEEPGTVADLAARVAAADALVISSPEYARGVAGTLKNALDWLVGGDAMPGKPVVLINASPRAVHAEAALRLTLETMSARIVEAACATLPLLGRNLTAEAIAADPDLAAGLRGSLAGLGDWLNTRVPGADPS